MSENGIGAPGVLCRIDRVALGLNSSGTGVRGGVGVGVGLGAECVCWLGASYCASWEGMLRTSGSVDGERLPGVSGWSGSSSEQLGCVLGGRPERDSGVEEVGEGRWRGEGNELPRESVVGVRGEAGSSGSVKGGWVPS